MVQALRSERVNLAELMRNTVKGEYSLSKLQAAYTHFFKERGAEISVLRSSDPDEYNHLIMLLSIKVLMLTESKGDSSDVYNRVMYEIREHSEYA
jgi:hypothetical protein